MKKIIITSIILFAAVIFFNKLSAQNPIPAFNVPVIADPTVFEETSGTSSACFSLSDGLPQVLKSPFNADERTLCVELERKLNKDYIWSTFMVYSLDGLTTYGPFTIFEGEVHRTTVDLRLWGVRVVNASSDAKLSVWFD